MKRLSLILAAAALAATLTAVHATDDSSTRVTGGGVASLADADGVYAGNLFAIAATVNAGGGASGTIHFELGEDFSAVWGAVPGVDVIELKGKVTGGTVNADGTVTLTGTLTERDFSNGDGLVFEEKDVPFEIVVDAASETFTLQWCLLPTFGLGVTEGALKIK